VLPESVPSRSYQLPKPVRVRQESLDGLAAALGYALPVASAPITYLFVLAQPAFEALFSDPELQLDLSRIIHVEQSFNQLCPLRAGDVVQVLLTIDKMRARGDAMFITIVGEVNRVDGTPVGTLTTTLLHHNKAAVNELRDNAVSETPSGAPSTSHSDLNNGGGVDFVAGMVLGLGDEDVVASGLGDGGGGGFVAGTVLGLGGKSVFDSGDEDVVASGLGDGGGGGFVAGTVLGSGGKSAFGLGGKSVFDSGDGNVIVSGLGGGDGGGFVAGTVLGSGDGDVVALDAETTVGSNSGFVVGRKFPPTASSVTRDQLLRYASVSGDVNPIHQSDAAARAIGLTGVLAHGMWTMGAVIGKVIAELGGELARVRSYRTRFAAPLYVPVDGATFDVSAEVVALVDGVATVTLDVVQKGVQILSGAKVEVWI
jgi:acyl dehydratase